MRKILLLLAIAVTSLCGMGQVNIPYTELNYEAHYHWGLVNVSIGHGVATIQTQGNQLIGTLDGNSIPWNGRVFCVSDTLKATMTPSAKGLAKEKVNYINGWYMKPKTTEFRSVTFNPDDPASFKNIHGYGELDASTSTMEAIDIMANMMALYYYFHEIDFPNMQPESAIEIPFTMSNGDRETVKITYSGPSHFAHNGNNWHTYSCVFEYTYRGEWSGFPVKVEVAAESRIPVYFAASLPIGKVEMIYAE